MHFFLRQRLWLAVCLGFVIPSAHAADEYLLEVQQAIGRSTAEDGTVSARFDALEPAVAADPSRRIALIVWAGDDVSISTGEDDDSPHLADNEFEIFGRLSFTDRLAPRSNQFRISVMGNDAETGAEERARFVARNPAVAWNPVASEFLVVWEGDDDDGALVDDEFEIFGQRINRSGVLQGERFRISTMGDETETDAAERGRYDALRPAVSVDPGTGNYLVAWQGDTDQDGMTDGEFEIFGRVIASDGTPTAAQVRISTMGSSSNANFDALNPAIAWNPVADAFVVAWEGDDNQGSLVDDEFEIHMQHVTVDGALAVPATRVSTMGTDGDSAYDALAPAVAVVPDTGTTFIAWQGDTSTSKLVDDEFEIHGQLLDYNGALLGSAVRVSIMGADAETDPATRAQFGAFSPGVTWNTADDYFTIAWHGDTDSGDQVDEELETFARFMGSDGVMQVKQFQVSKMATHAEDAEDSERAAFQARDAALAYLNGFSYLVWSGDSNSSDSIDGMQQVFAQRLAQFFTTFRITVSAPEKQVKAPEPATYPVVIENTGDVTAQNVRVRVTNSEDFPFSFSDCPDVNGNYCELGDLAADETAEFAIIVQTDHLELGDTQKSTFAVTVESDTAIKDGAAATGSFLAAVSLTVDGGNGAMDMAWLLLLGGIPLLKRRCRKQA